ncbi:hypothetical protein [Polaromonas sp.]|uniref:hypothetical protein n=1 Tax=Polaromonas sp. TaxID=1869339 RepID=UPI003BAB7ED6
MTSKKACLVFVPKLAALAQTVSSWLSEDGAEVCVVEIEPVEADAIRGGDYDQNVAVQACVDDADVCIFLLGDENTDEVLAAAGKVAASKRRVVVVVGEGASLPQIFDDAADAVVNATTPGLREVILGKDIRQLPDGSIAPQRVPARVKCQ